MRKFLFSTLIAAGLLTLSVPALANKLDVPIIEKGEYDGVSVSEIADILPTCTGSKVAGLDPGGDGFLAVRSGPGSQYRKLVELHNGDRVSVFDQKGDWAGVVYGELLSDERISPKTRPVKNSKKGWVNTKWLRQEVG